MNQVNSWKVRAYAAGACWLFFTLLMVGLYAACGSTGPQVAVSAADIVNEVVRRGDRAYAVSVSSCHTAERVAAELPDVQTATRAVERIRASCDHAFQSLELVRASVARVDSILAKVEAGALPVKDLVAAALDARALADQAEAEHEQLATSLQTGGP